MSRTTRRRIWWIATIAACFGLQAPLCIAACLDGSQPTPIAEHSAPPCHESSDAGSPEPSSHEDCGCDASVEALSSTSDELRSNVGFTAIAQTPIWRVANHTPPARRFVPHHVDLPPPDLLLLESTLLL